MRVPRMTIRPQFGLRTFLFIVMIFAFFLAYETTNGPWNQFQAQASSFAMSAEELSRKAQAERLKAAGLAKRAEAFPEGDADWVAIKQQEETHRLLARYFADLAAQDKSMERAYRRIAWRPWEPLPSDPLPLDPRRPSPPEPPAGVDLP